MTLCQVCGSRSQLDPDSSGSADPDPYSPPPGSGSRRAKITHRIKISEISCFEVLDVLFFERAEGFFCNLDVLNGGLGIGKLQFLKKKKWNFFSAVNFFQFLVIKTPSGLDPDPDPNWIRIGIQPKMLDPDPYQMNTDPQPCF